MADALNQIGQQTLTVSGTPVGLTMPLLLNSVGAQQRDQTGKVMRYTPRHIIFQVVGQPVRWRSDGQSPSGVAGLLQAAGSERDFTHWGRDFYSVISRIQFVRDAAATADATVEVAYFE